MTSALLASSSLYPLYYPRRVFNVYSFNGTNNPVEVAPTPFTMTKGYTTIGATDATTNYSWSFDVIGGTSPDLNNTSSFTFAIQGTAVGCTVTFNLFTSYTQYTVTTPSSDSGGRTYVFIFYNYPGVQPTIQKTTGTAIAANLIVTSRDSVFQPS